MTPRQAELEHAAQEILDREASERRERAVEEARERLEHQERAERHAAAVERARERLRAMDHAAIDRARAKAVAALGKYAAEIVAWNATLHEVYAELEATGVRDAAVTVSPDGDLAVHDVAVRHEGLQRGVAGVANEALDAHLDPRVQRDLGHPRD